MQLSLRERCWITYGPRSGNVRLRLFCLPYAGGSASLFRDWLNRLPGDVEVRGVQLPGHATRIGETPYTDVTSLVTALSREIEPFAADRPYALFGHSLGALVAFELARELERRSVAAPVVLFVSGRRAPQVPDTGPLTHNRSDAEVLAYIRDLNATPPELLDNPEMVRLMLPMLRSDLQMAETYHYNPGPPLSAPIVAFGGASDDESVEGRLEAWQEQTTNTFSRHLFEGDHFFIHPREIDVLDVLWHSLSKALART